MYKIQLSAPPPSQNKMLRYSNFKGLNLSTTATQIDPTESPDMQNMLLDIRGALDKRPGYARVFATSLGSGKVNGLYEYVQIDGTTKRLIAWGTNLYTQTGSSQPVSIYASMANALTRFFTFNNKCYIMDGTHYLMYDGTTVISMTAVGNQYIPTVTLGRAPAGGGTANEAYNLLGGGFKDSFTSDGVATLYTVSQTVLDATTVVVVYNNVTKTEGTHFTVNRTTGVINFAAGSAPLGAPLAGTNNVVITAYKVQTGYAARITTCTNFQIFGGTNDTRVFFFGNPTSPNYLWHCELFDPSYIKDTGFVKVGSDAGKIQAMASQYDTCVILKSPTPHDNEIYNMQYQMDSLGVVTFPMKPINSQAGCISPDSVQLLDNAPTFLTNKGIYSLTGSNVRDERNVVHVSEKIDTSANSGITALLDETNANLIASVSIDYEKKYIVVVGSTAYVYDYRLDENGQAHGWYKWTNIPASCFMTSGTDLYFGSNSSGLIYKFNRNTSGSSYNDDGVLITAYWKSKQISFGSDEHLKIVQSVFFSLKPDSATSADLYYRTDRTVSALIKTARVDLFDYSVFDYSTMTYAASTFPQETAAKVKAKKVDYFQLELRNAVLNESMGILSVGFLYSQIRLVK